MSRLGNYLALQAKARTGLNPGLFVWGLLAALGGAVTFGFLVFAAFIWLADRLDPLTAALALAGLFLLITIISLISCMVSRRRTVEEAKLALAARNAAPWLDPKVLGVGLQIGRAIGGRKRQGGRAGAWLLLAPLVVIGFVAAGMAAQRLSRSSPDDKDDEEDLRPPFARAA
jgi:hypothetical protein